MTEIGMALSNPYEGPRLPGAVGQPLPGVEVDVRPPVEQPSEAPRSVAPSTGSGSQGEANGGVTRGGGAERIGSGELHVRGGALFTEYWRRPQATRDAFDKRGFFATGAQSSPPPLPPMWRRSAPTRSADACVKPPAAEL